MPLEDRSSIFEHTVCTGSVLFEACKAGETNKGGFALFASRLGRGGIRYILIWGPIHKPFKFSGDFDPQVRISYL